jgi:hypothetical protein
LVDVAVAVILATESGLASVGSGLKATVRAVRLAVCEVVATLWITTSARLLPARTMTADTPGSAPLLALASVARA